VSYYPDSWKAATGRLAEIIPRDSSPPGRCQPHDLPASPGNGTQQFADATRESLHTREAIALEKRFYKPTESCFRFITEPDVEPTNNAAEQAIRFVAIHRRLTQGTRGADGQLWWAPIWTVIQTFSRPSHSLFEFLCAAVTAHFRSEPAPSLVARLQRSESPRKANHDYDYDYDYEYD
jgi:hypothetical protein